MAFESLAEAGLESGLCLLYYSLIVSASLQRGQRVPVRKLQLLTFPFMEVLLKTLILSFPSKDGDRSQISPSVGNYQLGLL